MTKKMTGVSDFQILDQGKRLLFSIDCADQEFTQFEIETSDLAKTIQLLVQNWILASHIRQSHGSPASDATAAWMVADTTSDYVPTSHSISLQLMTEMGIPIIALMGRDLAERTIRSLQMSIADAPPSDASAKLN